MQGAVAVLQAMLDRRIAFRLAIMVAGMFLAGDRRTHDLKEVSGAGQLFCSHGVFCRIIR